MKKVIMFCLLATFFFYGSAFGAFNFIDNGDGTVTDARTGLVWLKNASAGGTKTWADAVAYCSSLASGQAGLTDGSTAGQWRLPSKEELEGIGTDPPATWESGYPSVPWTMPGAPFTNVMYDNCWSGTSYAHDTVNAWFVYKNLGYVTITNKSRIYDIYVWPVRGSGSTTTTTLTTTTTSMSYSGGEIIQITNNNYHDYAPSVDEYGHVMWVQDRGIYSQTSDNYLMFYNGETILEIDHINSSAIDFFNKYVKIREGNRVVYQKFVGDYGQIIYFDGQEKIQLTNNNYDSTYPSICNGYIVWVGVLVSNVGNPDLSSWSNSWEIFLYKPAQPTAVKMSSLKATPSNKQVKVEWQTETEIDNAGFNVWRAEGFQKVNQNIISAEGSSIMGADYDFFDKWVMNGKLYYYLIEDIDNSGISTFHGPVKATPRIIYGINK